MKHTLKGPVLQLNKEAAVGGDAPQVPCGICEELHETRPSLRHPALALPCAAISDYNLFCLRNFVDD